MVTYVTNPFLLDKLELIPEMWLNIVSGILFVIYAFDNIVSGVVIKAIKKADITASKETDNTEEITKKVREILQSKSALHWKKYVINVLDGAGGKIMQSFWEEERKNYKEYESIRNDMRASVCVIGGGLTGLTTAYYLSKYTNVVLLERDRICSHTIGIKTEKVTSQHEFFYRYLIDSQ